MRRHLLVAPLVVLPLTTLAPGLAAQAIIAQTAGLTTPAQVVDFGANLLPNFTPVGTQFPGLTITHASYFTTGVSNNLVGGFLTNDFTAGPPNTLRIQFAQPITDVSFVYHQIATSAASVVRAVLQGVTVDSFSGTWNQSQPNNWFGFTNTLCDELQIDFVADFNVDTLAFNPVGAGACQYWNGTGVNPFACTCGTLPQLGTTWQGAVTLGPNTLATALVFAPGGFAAPTPLFGGELLVQSTAWIGFNGTGSYAWPLPASASWTGTVWPFQGVRLDVVGGVPTVVPLNAVRLVVGL